MKTSAGFPQPVDYCDSNNYHRGQIISIPPRMKFTSTCPSLDPTGKSFVVIKICREFVSSDPRQQAKEGAETVVAYELLENDTRLGERVYFSTRRAGFLGEAPWPTIERELPTETLNGFLEKLGEPLSRGPFMDLRDILI